MTGKTHVVVGEVTLAAYAFHTMDGIQVGACKVLPLIGLVTAAIGSYAPDIDIPDSHLGRKIRFISKHLKHRGITHTMLVPAILLGVLYMIPLPLVIGSAIYGFLFGYLAHIIADMFNSKGVPIFWPLMTSHFHVASIKTRSVGETMFMYIVIAASIFYATAGGLI